MLRERARAVDVGLRIADLAWLAAAWPAAWLIRDGLQGRLFPDGLYPLERYWLLPAVALPIFVAAAWLSQVYGKYRTTPIATEVRRVAQAVIATALAVAAAGFVTKQTDYSRFFVALYFAVAGVFMVGERVGLRLVARALRRRGYNTRSFAVVGTGQLARDIAASMLAHREWGLTFAGHVREEPGATPPPGMPVLGDVADLGSLLERHVVDEVIFAVPKLRPEELENAVALCEEQGVSARVCLNFFPRRIAKMSLEELEGVPVLGFHATPSDAAALMAKRAFDLFVSGLALLFFSPVLLLAALAIKLDSRGPIFFPQRRVGLNGREFTLFKFRSMVADAEDRLESLRHRNEMVGPAFKMKDDPRVTRVGRFLRQFSIDELPQFWNVLRGEMSVVGPRPPLPAEVRAYERWQRRRLSVKPGITCVWQVSGRNEIDDFDRWMELDLAYIDSWSMWKDVQIVLKTIPVVLFGRGAR